MGLQIVRNLQIVRDGIMWLTKGVDSLSASLVSQYTSTNCKYARIKQLIEGS